MGRQFSNVLVTGGCGFIGSNFIRSMLVREDFTGRIINLDKLTYAGNSSNLDDVAREHAERYSFELADVIDTDAVSDIFDRHHVDAIVHLAAESHVDRSIAGPRSFVDTNVVGTLSLLESARAAWGDRQDVLFHHVSTDEVYGSLGDTGSFKETTAYAPRSPYAATKASSDHLVRAYHHTYGLPVTISNCSNNYGPYQFPEKLIPLMILNMLEGKPLPIYGEGTNIRDWLHVEDHVEAIWLIIQSAPAGSTWNVGADNEQENVALVTSLCEIVASITGEREDHYKSLIEFVRDRPGHDQRYAVDNSKLKNGVGWRPRVEFRDGLRLTAEWYISNMEWVDRVRDGSYREWIERNYGTR